MYLGENSQYVFGYATAQAAISDNDIKLMNDIPNIIKTFKITTDLK